LESPAETSLDTDRTPLDEEESDNEEDDQDDENEEDADDQELDDEQDLEPLDVELQPLNESNNPPPASSDAPASPPSSPEPIFDDPSDSDDGEGEWITPTNVGLHKSRALELLPGDGNNKKGKNKAEDDEVLGAGCMTADFAMQNVLLQMGLNLVGVEGKRIQKVKSWVLRCHACFKCASFFFILFFQLDSCSLCTCVEYAKTPPKSSAPPAEMPHFSAHL
jgi:RNA-binding protein NOB1